MPETIKLLIRVNRILQDTDLTFSEFSRQVGYSAEEISELLYRSTYYAEDECIAQDVIAWLDLAERQTIVNLPVLCAADFKRGAPWG